jgi:membrane protein
VGKVLIGIYLGRSTVASSYGAAGSVVVLLVWVYYSAQLLFFGAELTQVLTTRFGRQIEPSDGAISLRDAPPAPGPAGAGAKAPPGPSPAAAERKAPRSPAPPS